VGNGVCYSIGNLRITGHLILLGHSNEEGQGLDMKLGYRKEICKISNQGHLLEISHLEDRGADSVIILKMDFMETVCGIALTADCGESWAI
jgi:hypothetical protein